MRLGFASDDENFAAAKKFHEFVQDGEDRAFQSGFDPHFGGNLRDAEGFGGEALFRFGDISDEEGENHQIERAHDEIVDAEGWSDEEGEVGLSDHKSVRRHGADYGDGGYGGF